MTKCGARLTGALTSVLMLGFLGCQNPAPNGMPVAGDGSQSPTDGAALAHALTVDVDPFHGAAFERVERSLATVSIRGTLSLEVLFPSVTHDLATGRTTVTMRLTNNGDALTFLQCQVSSDRPQLTSTWPFNTQAAAKGASQLITLIFNNPTAGSFTLNLSFVGILPKNGGPIVPGSAGPTVAPTLTPRPSTVPTTLPSVVPTPVPTPVLTPTPKPSPTPSPTPTPGGSLRGFTRDFEQDQLGLEPSDFVDPNDEGFSYAWMPRVTWRIAQLNGSQQYLHDGLANMGYLSFRRYRGAGMGTTNGQLPNHYFGQLDVTPVRSQTYSPTGDQGTQFYYLDPTHYVELLLKPTVFEVWKCNNAPPFQSAGWTRLYFSNVSTKALQSRNLSAEVDCNAHTIKAYLDGQLMTKLTVDTLSTQTHWFSLRGTGNIVGHDNVHFQAM